MGVGGQGRTPREQPRLSLSSMIHSAEQGRLGQHITSGREPCDLDSRLELLDVGSLPSPELVLTMRH